MHSRFFLTYFFQSTSTNTRILTDLREGLDLGFGNSMSYLHTICHIRRISAYKAGRLSAILSESGGTVKLDDIRAYLHAYIRKQPFLPACTHRTKHHLHGDHSAYSSTLGSACDHGLPGINRLFNIIRSDLCQLNRDHKQY